MPAISDNPIFLDTQVFYSNNFNFGRTAFKELVGRVETDRVRVVLTSITVREVKRHIHARVKDASKLVDKVRKDLRILESSSVPEVSVRARRLDGDAVTVEIICQFDKFLQQSRAVVLDCNDVDPEIVFDKYFNVVLPFEHREEKRREFPDAFVVEVLKSFAVEERVPITVISGDKGLCGAAKASGMKTYDSLELFLDSENREWDEKISKHLLDCYDRSVEKIKRDVEHDFEQSVFVLTDVNGEVENTIIKRITVSDEPLIVRVDESSAILETEVELSFTADISYDDPDATVYDKEDDRTYVFNTIEETIDEEVIFPLELTVYFDPSDDSYFDISIGKLNDGQDFEVCSTY